METTARKVVGKELCEFIDSKGLAWTESLPYSCLEGWSNGKFSIIYNGAETESLRSVKNRYNSIFPFSMI